MREDKAFLYRFLSLAFSYPDERMLAMLETNGENFEVAESNLELNCRTAEIINSIKESRRRLLDLQGEYNALFATSLKAPCRETAYELDKSSQRAAELADIEGFYRAFGLSLDVPLEPDSLVAELEFMSVLLQKQVYLEEANEAEGVAVCNDAYAKFLESHLGRWLDEFVSRLKEATEEEYYRQFGSLLESFVHREQREEGTTKPVSP